MAKRFLFSALFIISFFLLYLPQAVSAGGSFYLTPTSGTYTVGDTFTMGVVVGTGGEAINAGQATISYSSDNLEVVGVSSSGSVFSLWPKPPSAAGGVISFTGGVPTPGYNGNGSAISVTFKAKAAGTGYAKVSGGQLLLNDGAGTNILSGYGSASYTINSSEPAPAPAPAPSEPEPTAPPEPEEEPEEEKIIIPTPKAPIVSSETHPDQGTWYLNKEITLNVKAQEHVIGYSYELDRKKGTVPDEKPEGSDRKINMEYPGEGQWYFHIRAQSGTGWSKTTHFQINIDTIAPLDFFVKLESESHSRNHTPTIFFKASDTGSGINRYIVIVDDIIIATFPYINGDEVGYTIPWLGYGEHSITVCAFDMAGNMSSSTINIDVLEHEPGIGFWLGSHYILFSWAIMALLALIIVILLITLLLTFIFRFRKKRREQ